MKKAFKVLAGIVVIGAVLFSNAPTAIANSGVWTNEVDGLWSDTAAWLNGVVADGAGNTAAFSNQAAATVTVTLDSARTIGNLGFIQGTYTITNDGPLTLAGPAKPVIYVPSGSQATIRRTILAGTDGFTLDGGGTLNLYKAGVNEGPYDPPNTWTGGIILSNGTLMIQGDDPGGAGSYSPAIDNSLDGITSITFYNGSVLNLRPQARTTPGYGNLVVDLIVPVGESGTIILPPRFSGSAGDNSAAIGEGLGGTLTGSGTLNVNTIYIRGAIVGNWSAFSGQLNIFREGGPTGEDKQFRVGHPAGLPLAMVDLGGTTDFGFFYYRALTANTIYPIGLLTGNNRLAQLRGSATSGFTLIYDIGASQTNPADVAEFAGAIVNSAGPAGVIWRGAGTWRLTGNNTYTGPTIISNGTVVVGDGWEAGTIGSGPITNYTRLIFDRGGEQLLWVMGGVHGPGSVTNNGSATVILARTNTYTGPTAINSGRIQVGSGSILPGSVTVAAGAGFGVRLQTADGFVRVGSLSFGANSVLDYEFGGAANPAQTVLTNSGVLAMNGNVTVNISGVGLTPGTITLLTYASRSGPGTFVLGTLPAHVTGAYLTDDTANRRLLLTITSTFDPTLVWVGDAAGVWDVSNPNNKVWKIAGSGVSTYFTDGSWVRLDDSATGTTLINVNTTVSPGGTTVDNTAKAYTLGGAGNISGSGLLIKRGTNTLTINTAGNNWSGGTLIEAGTVRIGDGTTGATIDGSYPVTNNAVLTFNSAANNNITSVIRGSGKVVQLGPGELRLGAANAHEGGVEVGTGALYNHAHLNAVGGGGAPLVLDGGTVYVGAIVVGANPVIVLRDSFIVAPGNRIESPLRGTNVSITISNSALFTLSGDMQLFYGTVVLAGSGQVLRFNHGGTPCFGSSNALFLFYENTTLQQRNAVTTYLGAIAGGPGRIGEPSGVSGLATYIVGDLNTNTVFSGTIDDVAATRFTAFTKVGVGTLTLSNVNLAHKGGMTVEGGVLAFVGSTSNSPVTTNVLVAAPGILDLSGASDPTLRLGQGTVVQFLRGDGTIRGNVVLGGNARLLPGTAAAPVGILSVMGSVAIGGITTMEINRNAAPNSDRLVANSITGGGVLIVTNIGPADFAAGDTFTLFNRPVSGFTTVTLPALSAPLYWTNMLAIDGTIRVLSTVPTTPTNITLRRISATQLQLEWPASYIGWRLETNAVSVTATNQWFTWVNSTTTNRVVIDIDQSKSNVYFRLVYP